MQTKLYNQKGEAQGSVDLPDDIFNVPWNADLVYQVVVSSMSNSRKTIASTKDRSQVRGGGKKPWRQKGTGRARHGSTRSPLWKGGGVSHGPKKEKNFSKKINKKMSKGALSCVLSAKVRENSFFVLKDFDIQEAKTKKMDAILKELLKNVKVMSKEKKAKAPSTLILTPTYNRTMGQALRNLPYVYMEEARNININDLFSHKIVLLFEGGIETINNLFNNKVKSAK